MQKLQIRRGIHGKVLWRNNLMEIYCYLSALFGAVIGFLLGGNITRQQSTGNDADSVTTTDDAAENTGFVIVDGRLLANYPFPFAAILV